MPIAETLGSFHCPECGIKRASKTALSEHLENVHEIVAR